MSIIRRRTNGGYHTRYVDSGDISAKIQIREQATRDLKALRVLDCFAGANEIWSRFSNVELYLGIEKEKDKGNNLYADNVKVLPELDLSVFNVIDLDSYGIPAAQVQKIFKNKTLRPGTIIIYTAITNAMSEANKVLTTKNGIAKWRNKTKVMFGKQSLEMFYGQLYEVGVKHVFAVNQTGRMNKEYGYFISPGKKGSGEHATQNAPEQSRKPEKGQGDSIRGERRFNGD